MYPPCVSRRLRWSLSDQNTGKPLLRSLPYFLFYVSFWAADALFVPYLGLYFELRGMNSVQIGLLNSLFYLVTVISAVSIGYLADRTGRPRRTVTLCFAAVIFVIFYMSRAAGIWQLGLAYALYGYCTVSGCDLVDKLLLEHLGEDTRMYGIFRVGSPLGYSGGVILAGLLIPRFGFPVLFPACMAFAALCVMMGLLMQESAGARRTVRVRVPMRQLFRGRGPVYLYGTMVLWGFSEGGALSYQAVYLSDMGFSTEYTSVLITTAMIGQMAAFLLMPFLQARIRPENMVMLGFLVFGGRILSLTFLTGASFPGWLVLALHFLGGSAQAFVLTPITLMIGRFFSPGVSSTAQTMKTVASKGVGSSVGAFLYGWLYSVMPAQSVMLLFTCLIFGFAAVSRAGGAWAHMPAARPAGSRRNGD